MEKFRIVEHTADVGIEAFGATLEELFANAAAGMFSIVVDPDTVTPARAREIAVAADDLPALLAVFLSEALFVFETEGLVLHHAEVASVTAREARATLHGEPVAPKHEFFTEIKAVTHHNLAVEKRDGGWRATVLFDI